MFTLSIIYLVLAFAWPVSAEDAKPDGQMQSVLDELAKLGPKPLEKLTAEEARKQPGPPDAVKALLKSKGKTTDPEPVAGVKDVTFNGPAGKLPARIYTPKGNGSFPVLVYFHGGGWVIADIDAYDSSCRALCNASGALVVSCGYRQAPEHPFPAAADDAYAAYQWALKTASDWNGNPKKVAVGGESAGGNLAALTSIRARNERTPLPAYQLLVYPVTNFEFNTASYKEHADAKPLNKAMMGWFFANYFNKQSPSAAAFPLQTKDLRGLPPATVVTADIDPLRDDGKNYAQALQKAGVRVAYKNYEGVTHEFFGMGSVLDKAKDAVSFAAEGLHSGFED